MKTKIIFIGLIIFSIFFSCKKIDKLVTFFVDDQSEILIESSIPFSLPIEIPTPEITTNSEEEFKNNGTKTNLVKDVYLSELKLSIVKPKNKTFSFLKTIHIYIRTNDSDEIELAYQNNISSDSKTINLITKDSRLDKYIKSYSYKLRTEVTTKETLTQDISIIVNMRFKVTAHPY